ncbi:MAG: MoxR family ATPase [Kiritimatiellia bacterium]
MNDDAKEAERKVRRQSEKIAALRTEIGKVIVGQDHLVERMIIGLVTGGHILLEGVPGLAKTTAVKTLSSVLGLKFNRISFTPDLLPADVTGTLIYNPRDMDFTPRKGPIFTNLLLADEINRAPAKVQSALLEAMQEGRVTIGDNTYALPDPFLVMATQNPIEQEGTYHLPEAEVDRFMLKCSIGYPDKTQEREIMRRFTGEKDAPACAVLSESDIGDMRASLGSIYCDDKVADYILDIVFCTRNPAEYGLDIAYQIEYGASPRASIYLNLTARALAMLRGRTFATPQDVKDVAGDVLRHRIIVTYEAEAEEITSEAIIRRVLEHLPVP